jgi:hypothetical protein
METLPPTERVFTAPVGESLEQGKEMEADRENFESAKGLHVAYDYPCRLDLEVRITKIRYEVETLTDLNTGQSQRACMDGEGPPKSSYTWKTISNLIKLHVGFAIPTNRIELMLGHHGFTSGKICRTLESVAKLLLPVYLVIPELLSSVSILCGDDTPTRVLDLRDPAPAPAKTQGDESEQEQELKLHQVIDEELGWQSQRADGKGGKKSLNVSLVTGRTDKDPRSTLCFFRTHLGSFGNLLSRILEWRSPKDGKVTIQGDLSTTNLPDKRIREAINFEIAGCTAHCRRPFWNHREEDVGFCYYILTGFAMLVGLEKRIDFEGRTVKRILRIRGRYGRMIWEAMRNRCLAAMNGTRPTRTTDPRCPIQTWPPDTPLYGAAQYLVNHYDELTRYLDNPFLEPSNNGRERGLRIEKCMLSSSKFRKTRNGRAVLDVLRTINATCTTAELDLAVYLKYIDQNKDQLQDNPEEYTPYEVAKKLKAVQEATADVKQQSERSTPSPVASAPS